MMTTLRKKITAVALASTMAAGLFAITPASSAPVAPNQDGLKQSVQSNKEDVQRRRRGRWIGPAIALGVIGAIGAHQYHRNYYYDDYRYRGHYGPTYYYGPGYGYYAPRHRYYGW